MGGGNGWNFSQIGLPMVTFVILGSYGLSKLNQGRYDERERQRNRGKDVDTTKNMEKKKFDLEEEMKEININEWESKRIQRKD